MRVHPDRLADDEGIAAEAALPVAVAQHDQRMAAGDAVVVRDEQPPRCGRTPSTSKVVARHELSGHTFGWTACLDIRAHPGPADDAVEHGWGILELSIEGIRKARAEAGASSDLARSTSDCGSSTGNSRSRTALTRLKIAVFAPMPSAIDSTAAAAKAGERRSDRMP